MAAKTRAVRHPKTHRQRATEALAVATRAVTRLATQQERLEAELQGVSEALAVAIKRRDFLAQSPDLGDPEQLTIDGDPALISDAIAAARRAAAS